MDLLIELIFEIILEGSLEASTSKKVPLPIRILLIVFLAILFFGVFGLLIYLGIQTKSFLVIAVGIALLILTVIVVIMKVKEYKLK